MSALNVLSLFSGIGGLELGLERAGMTTVGQVEIDPYCRRVLAKHWPDVPRHDDVRTAVDWWTNEQRPRVDVVCGGFPCQPVSSAGLGRAQEDPRWLWPEMARVIAGIQPEWIIGENVPGLLRRGLADVLRDIRGLGYRARVGSISACAVGAPHMRSRLFIVAHAPSFGRDAGRPELEDRRERGPAESARGEGRRARTGGSGWWEAEPRLDRVAYGVPSGMDRLHALGNSVVPQVSEYVGRLIVNHAESVAA